MPILCSENLGECLIFLWTEKIREFLTDRFEALSSSAAKSSPALGQLLFMFSMDFWWLSGERLATTSLHF